MFCGPWKGGPWRAGIFGPVQEGPDGLAAHGRSHRMLADPRRGNPPSHRDRGALEEKASERASGWVHNCASERKNNQI